MNKARPEWNSFRNGFHFWEIDFTWTSSVKKKISKYMTACATRYIFHFNLPIFTTRVCKCCVYKASVSSWLHVTVKLVHFFFEILRFSLSECFFFSDGITTTWEDLRRKRRSLCRLRRPPSDNAEQPVLERCSVNIGRDEKGAEEQMVKLFRAKNNRPSSLYSNAIMWKQLLSSMLDLPHAPKCRIYRSLHYYLNAKQEVMT